MRFEVFDKDSWLAGALEPIVSKTSARISEEA